MVPRPSNLGDGPTFVSWSKAKTSERQHTAGMPSPDAVANLWSLRAHAVRNQERKSWTPLGSLHLVAAFTFCARDFGNPAPDPTASKAEANKVCLGSWKPNEKPACKP